MKTPIIHSFLKTTRIHHQSNT